MAHYFILIGLALLAGCGPKNSDFEWQGSDLEADRTSEFQLHPNEKPTPKTMFVMAKILAGQGKYAQSEALLKQLVQEFPKFTPAYIKLADLQMAQRRVPETIRTIDAGLKLEPRNDILINNLGMCYFVIGDYPRALAGFTQAAGINPENTRYRSNLALVLGVMGRQEESASLYEQVLSPQDAKHNVQVLIQAREKLQPSVN